MCLIDGWSELINNSPNPVDTVGKWYFIGSSNNINEFIINGDDQPWDIQSLPIDENSEWVSNSNILNFEFNKREDNEFTFRYYIGGDCPSYTDLKIKVYKSIYFGDFNELKSYYNNIESFNLNDLLSNFQNNGSWINYNNYPDVNNNIFKLNNRPPGKYYFKYCNDTIVTNCNDCENCIFVYFDVRD